VNKQLQSKLEAFLQADNQMQTDLSILPNCGVLVSKDKKLRIVTWNSPIDTGGQHYFGFLQVLNSKFNKYISFKLQDKSRGMDKPERNMLTPD
jgi:hypothetical protein